MSLSIQTNADRELQKLQRGLGEYARLSGKTSDEVLDQKGRDLGIRLYRGYRARRWGAGRNTKGRSGIAWKEAQERGWRVRVRPSIRSKHQGGSSANIRRSSGSVYRQSWWTRAVADELNTRQRGIGVLATSFLWFRRRRTRARGTFFVRNKTGRMLGFVQKLPGSFRIVGRQPALAEVGNRYGIPARAIAAVNADMAPYLARKQLQEVQRSFRRSGLIAA